jgi:hypothetical protein
MSIFMAKLAWLPQAIYTYDKQRLGYQIKEIREKL